MSRIFISHSSSDNADAEEMADRLRQAGYEALFLDFDPADGIPAGHDWERELYTQLRACRGMIVLCSDRSMTSDWVFAEITQARALGKRLFPVIVKPCKLRTVLQNMQIVDLWSDREGGYQRLWDGMLRAGLDPADFFKWDITRPPYPGLLAYEAEDAAVYFGRDDDRRKCLDTLERMKRYDAGRMLVLAGASGSGKSSLLRAGLLPRLRRMPDWIVVTPFRPRHDPVMELAGALTGTFAKSQPDAPQLATDNLLRGDDADALATVFQSWPDRDADQHRAFLLIIDQLEELLTTSDPDRARQFVSLLNSAMTAQDSRLFCIATLRSDYVAALQTDALWQHTPFREYPLAPLTPADLTVIVSRPALMAGIELEEGLVETLVRDVGSDDALPLLAFTLNRLWHDYAGDREITLDEYLHSVGGIKGAIRDEAEGVLAAFALSNAKRADLRQVFRGLVRIDVDGRYTRKPLAWHDVPAPVRPVVDAFVEARLLVTDRAQVDAEARDGAPATPILEIAHEALFTHWTQLKEWLRDDRTFLLWHQRAHAEADAWQSEPADNGLLLRGGRLAEAQRWLAERADDIDDTLRRFVQESGRAERRNRWLRRTLSAGIVFALAVVSVLYLALLDEQQETLRRLIDSYWSVGIAARDSEVPNDPLRAAHHFARIADRTQGAERANALTSLGILTGGTSLQMMLAADGIPDRVVATDDGKSLAVASGERIQLFGIETGRELAAVSHSGKISDLQFGAGPTLVSLSDDGRIFLTGASSPARELPQTGVRGFALGHDGRRLLTWGAESDVRIWGLPDGHPRDRLDRSIEATDASFLPGDDVLVWSRDAQLMKVWHPGDTARMPSWPSRCGTRQTLPSPDATQLLNWCEKTLHLRTLAIHADSREWRSPDWVDGARFMPNGRAVVTWDTGAGRVTIWPLDQAGESEPQTLMHGAAIRRVLLTPDSTRLVTSGADGKVRLWDASLKDTAQRERATATQTADGKPVDVQMNVDGSRLLSSSQGSAVHFWDTRTMTPLALPMTHGPATRGATFFDADHGIVTWGRDGTVRVWRRTPAHEVTAPVEAVQEGTLHPNECGGQPNATGDKEARAALEAAGLADTEVLARCSGKILVNSGTGAFLFTADTPVGQRPPPIRLAEPVRGGTLDRDDRVIVWGLYSLRVWDGATGRPLSGLWRSDILNPTVVAMGDRLLTRSRHQARRWQWRAASADGADISSWLETVTGTRLDQQQLPVVMSQREWCEHPSRQNGSAAGCPQ